MNETELFKKWRCRAVFFDFNGVIVNDEPLHAELMQQVLHKEGVALSLTHYHELALGVTDRAGFAALLRAAGREPHETLLTALIERKSAAYLQAIVARDLLFPGVRNLLEQLSSRLPIALVSGALRAEIEAVTQRSQIRRHFQTIIASEDVSASKPDPEGYLKALACLNQNAELQPADCLVIEDSLAGIAAARRAGMRCLAVTTSFPATALHEADAVVSSLDEVAELILF